tara:strand:- start:317 stop:793 length:477 start_codon:yes stop_codon:yes gene_type:complete
MDKSFQKEILEKRRSMLFNKELKNIDTRNTLKPIRTRSEPVKKEPEYLIIGDDNALNSDLKCHLIQTKETNFGNMPNQINEEQKRHNLFEEIRNSEPFHNDIYKQCQDQEQKQITIDFNENKSNLVTKKSLVIFGVCIVLSYITITALNDYIMLSYFS